MNILRCFGVGCSPLVFVNGIGGHISGAEARTYHKGKSQGGRAKAKAGGQKPRREGKSQGARAEARALEGGSKSIGGREQRRRVRATAIFATRGMVFASDRLTVTHSYMRMGTVGSKNTGLGREFRE